MSDKLEINDLVSDAYKMGVMQGRLDYAKRCIDLIASGEAINPQALAQWVSECMKREVKP